jgi:hypothetical protein
MVILNAPGDAQLQDFLLFQVLLCSHTFGLAMKRSAARGRVSLVGTEVIPDRFNRQLATGRYTARLLITV